MESPILEGQETVIINKNVTLTCVKKKLNYLQSDLTFVSGLIAAEQFFEWVFWQLNYSSYNNNYNKLWSRSYLQLDFLLLLHSYFFYYYQTTKSLEFNV